MSSDKHPQQTSDKSGATALDHEANHVENITRSKEAENLEGNDSELEKAERNLRVEQNARNEALGSTTRRFGDGNNEPDQQPNQDG